MKKFIIPSLAILAILLAVLFVALPHHASAHQAGAAHVASAGTRNQEIALLSNGVAIDQVTTDKVLQCADVYHVMLGYAGKVMTNVPDWGGTMLINSTSFSSGLHTEEDTSHVVRVYDGNAQPC